MFLEGGDYAVYRHHRQVWIPTVLGIEFGRVRQRVGLLAKRRIERAFARDRTLSAFGPSSQDSVSQSSPGAGTRRVTARPRTFYSDQLAG
jgi:hypothetical protein